MLDAITRTGRSNCPSMIHWMMVLRWPHVADLWPNKAIAFAKIIKDVIDRVSSLTRHNTDWHQKPPSRARVVAGAFGCSMRLTMRGVLA